MTLKNHGNKPYISVILILLVVILILVYFLQGATDRAGEAFKMRQKVLRDSIALVSRINDSLLDENKKISFKLEATEEALEERKNKVQNEIRLIEYREKEFKTLDDHSRDSLIRTYIAANQGTDW